MLVWPALTCSVNWEYTKPISFSALLYYTILNAIPYHISALESDIMKLITLMPTTSCTVGIWWGCWIFFGQKIHHPQIFTKFTLPVSTVKTSTGVHLVSSCHTPRSEPLISIILHNKLYRFGTHKFKQRYYTILHLLYFLSHTTLYWILKHTFPRFTDYIY